MAIKKNDAEMARVLLASGASADRQDTSNLSPLDYAIPHWNGENRPVLVTLLDYRSSADALDSHKSTLLHRAAREGNTALAEVLLDHKVSVDARNGDDETALHLAVHARHTAFAQVLLDHGASVNAKDDLQSTPLHIASLGDDTTLAKILLNHGASVDAIDYNDSTPLHYAALKGSAATAEILLDHGASVTRKEDAVFQIIVNLWHLLESKRDGLPCTTPSINGTFMPPERCSMEERRSMWVVHMESALSISSRILDTKISLCST